jgi:hypothetical protein
VEAKLESNFQASLNDNGDSGGFYEIGTNLKLTPLEARSGSRLTKDDVDKILQISCPTCYQGLVGYWPFDEGSITIAKDYSGNGNNGTLVNVPTWTTGKVGGALSFNNNYVRIRSINIPGDQITMMAWINIPNSPYHHHIISKPVTTTWTGPFLMWMLRITGNKLCPHIGNGVTYSYLCSINSVPLNAWSDVASTFMKPVMKNYINGILDNSGNINLSIGSSSYDVAVGARHPDDPG